MLAWPAVRSPTDTIPAPPFPRELRWFNVAALRMDKQRGRPVLVEFWDFCRANSLRTLPYLQAWHERYGERGLRVIGVHTGGWDFSRDEDAIGRAIERLGITYPVVCDTRLEIWDFYGNHGWPARYLWTPEQALFSMHYGEGAYAETEAEIQAFLGVEEATVPPFRAEDVPGLLLPAQTEDHPGAHDGPYEAGAVWAVCDGTGALWADGDAITIAGPGCYPVREHAHHTVGALTLEPGDGVTVAATCFTPGVAPPAA